MFYSISQTAESLASSSSGSGCTGPSRRTAPALPSSKGANGPAPAPRFQVPPGDNDLGGEDGGSHRLVHSHRTTVNLQSYYI